jgi:hypothetical protein
MGKSKFLSYFPLVKWSRFPPICALLCITINCLCRQLPEFNQAIDPTELDLEHVYQHLDTITNHRKPVSLSFLEEEFPDHTTLSIETYFQKSESYKLLRLSSYRIVPGQLFVMAEGWGTTYLKISDQHCDVVSAIITGPFHSELLLLYRKCNY